MHVHVVRVHAYSKVAVHYIDIKYTSCDTVVFDYIQFSKFNMSNINC